VLLSWAQKEKKVGPTKKAPKPKTPCRKKKTPRADPWAAAARAVSLSLSFSLDENGEPLALKGRTRQAAKGGEGTGTKARKKQAIVPLLGTKLRAAEKKCPRRTTQRKGGKNCFGW
jgi:hypothetical protein